jgi:hypothetical protein
MSLLRDAIGALSLTQVIAEDAARSQTAVVFHPLHGS